MKRESLNRKKSLLAVAVAATLGLAACEKESQEEQLSEGEVTTVPEQSASLDSAVDDAAITSDIKNRLATDPRTQNAQIEVSSSQGTVTLTGSAPSPEAKDAAEELARNVAAVQDIDNRIEAPSELAQAGDEAAAAAERAGDRAGENVSDALITTKVKAKLASDDQVKARDINVSTEAGVVELKGTVPDEQAKRRAIELARNTEGVKNVEDELIVDGRS